MLSPDMRVLRIACKLLTDAVGARKLVIIVHSPKTTDKGKVVWVLTLRYRQYDDSGIDVIVISGR